MALPTAKRPKIVEDELQEELEAKRRARLIVKVDKIKIFMDSMKAWYKGLKSAAKLNMTHTILKRKAIYICYHNRIVYDRLPLTWVKQLQQEVGLKFHPKSSIRLLAKIRAANPEPESSIPAKKDEDVPINRRKFKKILDLSSELPPPEWIDAYVKGIVLPRQLKIYSAPDLNIIYYDYEPKLVDSSGNEYKIPNQPRHNLDALVPRPHKKAKKRVHFVF
ncbi:hypothetical protein Ocin01_08584 [Orchesella cincta]|uniref:Uncharacterized protein n=1 Tax=Orchesella cincta TaxID=48709 RepID=A0A1D2MZL5_ORCCI|nr:hypothetical protein Ocin01_08584 [Orchesella cincta]